MMTISKKEEQYDRKAANDAAEMKNSLSVLAKNAEKEREQCRPSNGDMGEEIAVLPIKFKIFADLRLEIGIYIAGIFKIKLFIQVHLMIMRKDKKPKHKSCKKNQQQANPRLSRYFTEK